MPVIDGNSVAQIFLLHLNSMNYVLTCNRLGPICLDNIVGLINILYFILLKQAVSKGVHIKNKSTDYNEYKC